jgi:hypothetical protein
LNFMLNKLKLSLLFCVITCCTKGQFVSNALLEEVVLTTSYGNGNSQNYWNIQNMIVLINQGYQNQNGENPNTGGCDNAGGSWDQCGNCVPVGGTYCIPPPNPGTVDCANVEGGTATFTTECGCIGGTTGILACPPNCDNYTNSNFAASGGATIVEGTFSVSISSNTLLYGLTYPERVNADISVCFIGGNWKAVLTSFTAEYSYQTRMRPFVINISGTTFTNQYNFCAQASDLKATTHAAQQYYNINAVIAHEDIHKSRFQPALNQSIAQIESYFETNLSVPYTGQTEQVAIQQIKNLNAWNASITFAYNTWKDLCLYGVLTDHGSSHNGPAYIAERQITDPIRLNICALANFNSWGSFCSGCF